MLYQPIIFSNLREKLADIQNTISSIQTKSLLDEHLKQTLEQLSMQAKFLEEDLEHTEKSFQAKDAIDNHAILKKTKTFTIQIYSARLGEIYKQLIQSLSTSSDFKKQIRTLAAIRTGLLSPLPYSFDNQEPFNNPYPQYLFFSQMQCKPHFSTKKSQRERIAGYSINEIAKNLKEGKESPDYLRVDMYFAPDNKGILHPYVFNNRTWVTFSKSGIPATRIAPIVPTQDCLNRISKLDSHDPNTISNEYALKEKTETQRPHRAL